MIICLCLDDIKSVEKRSLDPKKLKNCKKRVPMDVSRMERSKRLGHLKKSLESGRQEEGLGRARRQNGVDL